jgi:hypothetical protein
MGMVGPDEPRYADVGRAMAQSGDWITPRLWGHPWFEKPALLYWMTGAGFRLGLGADLAPRLPVALLSLAFLAFFWWRLRIEWDARVAFYATAMLATSAGWLTYSHVAVTDLPLAAFFSLPLYCWRCPGSQDSPPMPGKRPRPPPAWDWLRSPKVWFHWFSSSRFSYWAGAVCAIGSGRVRCSPSRSARCPGTSSV